MNENTNPITEAGQSETMLRDAGWITTEDNFENSEAVRIDWTAQAKGRLEAYSAISEMLTLAPTVERDGNWRAEAQRKHELREYFVAFIDHLEGEEQRLLDQLRQMKSWTLDDEPVDALIEKQIKHVKLCLDSSSAKLSVVRKLSSFWVKGTH